MKVSSIRFWHLIYPIKAPLLTYKNQQMARYFFTISHFFRTSEKIAGNENPKPNKPQKLGLQPKYKNDLACKKKHLATILKSKAG